MSDTFKFWTHGVSVIPEYTKQYTGHDNGLFMRRAGWGALVRQNANTENWFHFAIPSATMLDDDRVSHYRAWLRVKVNHYAVIDNIQIREATGPSIESPVIYNTHDQDAGFSISDQQGEFSFELHHSSCTGPLLMCVHAIFNEDAGEILFVAAGGWFEERT